MRLHEDADDRLTVRMPRAIVAEVRAEALRRAGTLGRRHKDGLAYVVREALAEGLRVMRERERSAEAA